MTNDLTFEIDYSFKFHEIFRASDGVLAKSALQNFMEIDLELPEKSAKTPNAGEIVSDWVWVSRPRRLGRPSLNQGSGRTNGCQLVAST